MSKTQHKDWKGIHTSIEYLWCGDVEEEDTQLSINLILFYNIIPVHIIIAYHYQYCLLFCKVTGTYSIDIKWGHHHPTSMYRYVNGINISSITGTSLPVSPVPVPIIINLILCTGTGSAFPCEYLPNQKLSVD